MWKAIREVAIFLCTCLMCILAIKNAFGDKFQWQKYSFKENGSYLDHKPQNKSGNWSKDTIIVDRLTFIGSVGHNYYDLQMW